MSCPASKVPGCGAGLWCWAVVLGKALLTNQHSVRVVTMCLGESPSLVPNRPRVRVCMRCSLEESIRRIAELDIRCSEAEGASLPRKGSGAKGDTSASARARTRTEEREALTNAHRVALAAKDAEIAALKATLDDVRRRP